MTDRHAYLVERGELGDAGRRMQYYYTRDLAFILAAYVSVMPFLLNLLVSACMLV